MKKINVSLSIAAIIFCTVSACRKVPDNVSQVEKASWPTITILGSQFYSIPVGGTIPNVAATSYDSVLKESYPVLLDASAVDATKPGLAIVPLKAKNKFGFISSLNVLIAITDISESANLSGEYKRGNTSVEVEEIESGLYSTNNFFGAPSTPGTYAFFAQINDSTIAMPTQETSEGLLKSSDHFLHQLPGDTTYGYKLQSITINRVLRVFKKQ